MNLEEVSVLYICMHVCDSVCTCIYVYIMYVCVYMYMYMYICIVSMCVHKYICTYAYVLEKQEGEILDKCSPTPPVNEALM